MVPAVLVMRPVCVRVRVFSGRVDCGRLVSGCEWKRKGRPDAWPGLLSVSKMCATPKSTICG